MVEYEVRVNIEGDYLSIGPTSIVYRKRDDCLFISLNKKSYYEDDSDDAWRMIMVKKAVTIGDSMFSELPNQLMYGHTTGRMPWY